MRRLNDINPAVDLAFAVWTKRIKHIADSGCAGAPSATRSTTKSQFGLYQTAEEEKD